MEKHILIILNEFYTISHSADHTPLLTKPMKLDVEVPEATGFGRHMRRGFSQQNLI